MADPQYFNVPKILVREPRLMVPGQPPAGNVRLDWSHPLLTCLPRDHYAAALFASNGQLIDGITGQRVGASTVSGSGTVQQVYALPNPKNPDDYGRAVTTFYHFNIKSTGGDYTRYLRFAKANGYSEQIVGNGGFSAGVSRVWAGYGTTSIAVSGSAAGKPVWNTGWFTSVTRAVDSEASSANEIVKVIDWSKRQLVYDISEAPSDIAFNHIDTFELRSSNGSTSCALAVCVLGVVPDVIVDQVLADPCQFLIPA